MSSAPSASHGNGDGVGDLVGIERRLPYLADLGVDAVWITPFYPSPQHDHGYDVADYRTVDPRLGTLEQFERLTREAEGRKSHTATSLYDSAGRLLATAGHAWIHVDPGRFG